MTRHVAIEQNQIAVILKNQFTLIKSIRSCIATWGIVHDSGFDTIVVVNSVTSTRRYIVNDISTFGNRRILMTACEYEEDKGK